MTHTPEQDVRGFNNEIEREHVSDSTASFFPVIVLVVALLNRIQEIADRASSHKDKDPRLPSRLPKPISGKPGKLKIVNALPQIGKSAIAVKSAIHAATKLQVPVLLYSLSMNAHEMTECLVAEVGGIDLHRLHYVDFIDDDWSALAKSVETLRRTDIVIVEATRLSLQTLYDKTVLYAKNYDMKSGVVVIDGVDFLQPAQSTNTPGTAAQSDDMAAVNLLEQLAQRLNFRVSAVRHTTQLT